MVPKIEPTVNFNTLDITEAIILTEPDLNKVFDKENLIRLQMRQLQLRRYRSLNPQRMKQPP